MSSVAGPTRGRVREFTTIAAFALVTLWGCCCPADEPESKPCATGCIPAPTRLERCGEQALAEGKPVEARAYFFEAMRGQSCPFLSWIGVARASIALGDLKTAEIAISQAMQTNPGDAASFDLVGRTVLMVARARGEDGRGQALLADALLDRASRMNPGVPKLAYHRGLAHLAASDPSGATVFLERSLATEGRDDDTIQALMMAYRRSGQTERAQALAGAIERERAASRP